MSPTRWRGWFTRRNGVKFRREYLCSHPAQVVAAHFTADKPAAYTGSIELVDSHNANSLPTDNG